MRGVFWAALLVACAQPTAENARNEPGPQRVVRDERVDIVTMPPPPEEAPQRVPPLGEIGARPPPISGGTLLYAGGRLIAGDEITESIYVVDPDALEITAAVRLGPGAMPGRMAADDDGMVHVVLRRAGEVARIDPSTGAVLARTAVCPAPRGISHDRARDRLVLVCMGGALLALTPTHERILERRLDPDLRDVVTTDFRIYVTRFRSAELLILDPDGVEVARTRPPEEEFAGVDPPVRMAARVAWRMRPSPHGTVLVAHQLHVSSDLGAVAVSTPAGPTYYVAAPADDLPTAVIENRITTFDADGRVVRSQPTTSSGLLVDVAPYASSAIGAYASDREPAVAVEPIGGGRYAILYQHRRTLLGVHEPLRGDLFIDRPYHFVGLNRGQRLFHEGSSIGVSCASCHPGGREDGHTWLMPAEGLRRSQSLLGGLVGTEPFHWGGELADFDALMDAQGLRMLRGFNSEDRAAMIEWLDDLTNPPAPSASSADAEDAFISAGCAECHAGPRLSDELGHDVGLGAIQTPRLRGVAYRAPYFHDGCAATLEETLDGTCRPPDVHGVADREVRARVVAHLRSL